MKKLLIAILLCAPVYAPIYASAQSETQEGHDEHVPGTPAAGERGSAAKADEHHGAGHHGDPTQHFNWLGSPFEHYGKDLHGGKLGDGEMTDPKTGVTTREEEAMSAPFIWAVFNFVILLLILFKWFRPMARRVAVGRHDEIKKQLDEATLREQAAAKLAEYETRIKDVDAEVKKLVDGIRADAEADKKRILAAAEAQAVQMKREAEQRIAAEIEMARAQLTREVTLAATGAAEKLLRDRVTPDDQRKLVSTFLSNVEGR